MIIYPARINNGCTIGVTATSGGVEDERDVNRLNNAILNFEKLGFAIVETENVRKCDKLVSSSGEIRAKEFIELWNDKKVRYIIPASGGEFLMEMLPYLHEKKLDMSEADWVQGFSDTSLLLLYLTTNYNLATVHANGFKSYCMREMDESLINTINILKNEKSFLQESFEMYEKIKLNREESRELEPFNLTEKVLYKTLHGEKKINIEGRLIGGCIDTIKSLIGTKFDNVENFCSQFKEGMFWYLENCEMNVCDLYRALWQMKEAGWFKNINGVIIGRTSSKESVGEFTYEDVLEKIFGENNIPVVYDVDFGHVAPQWTFINGSFAKFEYENGKGKITQEWR